MLRLRGIASYILIMVLLGNLSLSAGKIDKIKYIASAIDPLFRDNADAVVRYESLKYIINRNNEATFTFNRVVTIFTPEGLRYSSFLMNYNRFSTIKELNGTIYDAEGNEVGSLEKEDINDYSASQGYSLYEDNRVKTAHLTHTTFPYTIEISYIISFQGFLTWPTWTPQEHGAPVEYSKFEFSLPKPKILRYWSTIEIQPVISIEGNTTTYSWEADSFPRFVAEPVSADHVPGVQTAPDDFEIDGYEGNLSSWKSFGEWFFNLTKDRQTLPDAERQQITGLSASIPDKREQIRKIYEYMQSKTRYVSIQLGIGGWQPFDATFVSEKGYGDCKALTNYMLSLLKVINIEAYPALIHSSRLPPMFNPEFPSNIFNHVVLFVPLPGDTIWLECTSQTIPFGHIGRNNENRYALVITPSGGELVHTPSSASNENIETFI